MERKTKILIRQSENDECIDLDLIVNGQNKYGKCTLRRDFDQLFEISKSIASAMHQHGVSFGDYEILNGVGRNPLNTFEYRTVKKVDARKYSDINFGLLNEMMKLTA